MRACLSAACILSGLLPVRWTPAYAYCACSHTMGRLSETLWPPRQAMPSARFGPPPAAWLRADATRRVQNMPQNQRASELCCQASRAPARRLPDFVVSFRTLLSDSFFHRRRTTKCRNRFRWESALSPKLWAWQRLKNSGATRTAVAVAWTTECQMCPSALSFFGAQIRGKQASPMEAIGEAARPQSRRIQSLRSAWDTVLPTLRPHEASNCGVSANIKVSKSLVAIGVLHRAACMVTVKSPLPIAGPG